MDVVVDNYFLGLERIGDQIEKLESQIVTDLTERTLGSIYPTEAQLGLDPQGGLAAKGSDQQDAAW